MSRRQRPSNGLMIFQFDVFDREDAAAIDRARVGAGVGSLAIGGALLADEKQIQRGQREPAGLRDEDFVFPAGIERMVGDLQPRGPDAGRDQSLPDQIAHQHDSDDDKRNDERGQQPVGLAGQMGPHRHHDERGHDAVPHQAGRQHGEQRPARRGGDRQPIGQVRAGTIGPVGVRGDIGQRRARAIPRTDRARRLAATSRCGARPRCPQFSQI